MTEKIEQSRAAQGVQKLSSAQGAPLILIVTKNGRVSPAAMQSCLNIAERLGYSMLVAYVNTLPFLWDGGRRERFLEKAAKENFREFCEMTRPRNTYVASVKEYGKVGKVIRRLCHIVKRVDMVVVDKGVNREESVASSPVPVFCVEEGRESTLQKVHCRRKSSASSLSFRHTIKRQSTVLHALSLGLCVAGLYCFFFSHLDFIMESCAQGGLYAIVPLVATCVFFLVQNAFISAVVAGIKKQRGFIPVRPVCSPSLSPSQRNAHRAQR